MTDFRQYLSCLLYLSTKLRYEQLVALLYIPPICIS